MTRAREAGVRTILTLALAVALWTPGLPARAADAASKTPALQRLLDTFVATRSAPEHLSAVSLSVSFPGSAANLNLVSGRVSRAAGAAPITPETLFQIGSVTKSFTAAAILQLEAEGKLSIDQTVGDWLPQYPAWRSVSIRRLLNMTSGIATYDDVPATMRAMDATILRRWTPEQLIAFVDPVYGKAPRPTTGWNYSNTNYLLAALIIERVTGNSYGTEIARRFFGPKLGLGDTYYSANIYPEGILNRMAAGYFFNSSPANADLRDLLGRDMRTSDMSWAQAAGGIVSRPEDVTHWARALYQGEILPAAQRRELLSIVSNMSGKAISDTSLADPLGFGLGVGRSTRASIGSFWYYEGMTLGYRMLYAWFPKTNIVIAVAANSQPPDGGNRLGALLESLYLTLVKN